MGRYPKACTTTASIAATAAYTFIDSIYGAATTAAAHTKPVYHTEIYRSFISTSDDRRTTFSLRSSSSVYISTTLHNPSYQLYLLFSISNHSLFFIFSILSLSLANNHAYTHAEPIH